MVADILKGRALTKRHPAYVENMLEMGNRVRIYGLEGESVRHWNDLEGTICRKDEFGEGNMPVADCDYIFEEYGVEYEEIVYHVRLDGFTGLTGQGVRSRLD